MKRNRCVLGLFLRALPALLVASLWPVAAAQAQTRTRAELPFPDLPGFVTLRCDFHLHTVFSDGQVWPTVRAEEAWRDGLDVIALTDHEMRPAAMVLMLLTSAAVLAAEPETTGATAKSDYTIGVEDVLRISVWGETALNQQVRVRPDGKISFPLVGEIAVAGLTPDELRRELAERLSKFIRDPNVTVIVEDINSFRIYLLGQVRTQGVQVLKGPMRLLQAIAAAGGLTEFAKKDLVVIREQGGVERRIRVDYRKLLSGDDSQGNILLRPGDTILAE